jgi:hypothetical protein
MARKSPSHMRSAIDEVPRIDAVQSDTPASKGGGFTALWESATQEILAVTYWFEPSPHPGPYPVTVRFSGRRVDVKGRLQPGDRFVHDETIEEVVPGSGPISLTARVRDINAGEWAVTTRLLGPLTLHMVRGSRRTRTPRLVPSVQSLGSGASGHRLRSLPNMSERVQPPSLGCRESFPEFGERW